jgi:hypothetical protein
MEEPTPVNAAIDEIETMTPSRDALSRGVNVRHEAQRETGDALHRDNPFG